MNAHANIVEQTESLTPFLPECVIFTPIMVMMTNKRLSAIERVLLDAMKEYQYYSNPANQVKIDIKLVKDPVKRTRLMLSGVGMLGLAGVGVITPVMPTWPFALVAVLCFARTSQRVRNWVMNNQMIKTLLSMVYSRNEKPFVWTRTTLQRLMA